LQQEQTENLIISARPTRRVSGSAARQSSINRSADWRSDDLLFGALSSWLLTSASHVIRIS